MDISEGWNLFLCSSTYLTIVLVGKYKASLDGFTAVKYSSADFYYQRSLGKLEINKWFEKSWK